MSTSVTKELPDEEATMQFGKQLANLISQNGTEGCVIYLHGELGAGKTTLVRAVLQGLGYHGRVKSPTYTLVERYDVEGKTVFHFDLYRLGDPEELEFMGIRDYLDSSAYMFVEWPERGLGYLAPADVDIKLAYHGEGRRIECVSLTDKGGDCLKSLAGHDVKLQ